MNVCQKCQGTRLVPVHGSMFMGAPVQLPCDACDREWMLQMGEDLRPTVLPLKQRGSADNG